MTKISGIALIAFGLLHSLIALVMPGAIGFSGIWQEIVDVGVSSRTKVIDTVLTFVKARM